MLEFFRLTLTYPFLQNGLIACLMASWVSGIIGTFVVIKRIALISGGIAHTVLGGIGLIYYLGHRPDLVGESTAALFLAHPDWGAYLFAVLAAGLIGWVKLKGGQREDILISAMWAVGMAAGVVFMYLTPGYSVNLISYMFGDILMVSRTELVTLGIVSALITILVTVFYRQFVLISFDQEMARLRGLRVGLLYILLLTLIALTIVILSQIVGLILVIALLTLPAASAGLYTRTVLTTMLVAIALSIVYTVGGMILAFGPDLPPGAVIILFAGTAYIGLALVQKRLFT